VKDSVEGVSKKREGRGGGEGRKGVSAGSHCRCDLEQYEELNEMLREREGRGEDGGEERVRWVQPPSYEILWRYSLREKIAGSLN